MSNDSDVDLSEYFISNEGINECILFADNIDVAFNSEATSSCVIDNDTEDVESDKENVKSNRFNSSKEQLEMLDAIMMDGKKLFSFIIIGKNGNLFFIKLKKKMLMTTSQQIKITNGKFWRTT